VRRVLTYATAFLALALALAAMTWAALRPGEGPLERVGLLLDGAIDDLGAWYRSGPADAHPDWEAAAHEVHGADPERGARLMVAYGCGACHAIPGIPGASGTVGPHLDGFARRAYVAGVLPNEPGGLVRWIVDPPAHSPMTAMPDLGVTEAEARDMAAYLYNLRGA
jgi:cytochrome c2